MKNSIKIIATVLLTSSSLAYSQIVIGGETGSAGSNTTSVLLDFPTGENKGIIVPYVTTLPTTAPTRVEGTIVLDASSTGGSRVKFYNGITTTGADGWFDLSGQDGNVSVELTQQPLNINEADSKVIIGADTSSADGALVLESTNKAMVLPIVSDVQNIPNPSPGMLVYVNKQGSKRLAVYNGNKWSFWKP